MARSERHNRNLERVTSMLDGTYKGKIVVGTHVEKNVHEGRKVGDKWTDSDGVEWEQKEGYRSKVNRMPSVGIFSQVCKDCGTNCSKNSEIKVHNEVWKKFNRCYYCQINFEAKLKSTPLSWWAWTRLQDMQRWVAGRKELEQWIDEQHKINQGKIYDASVANALTNANVEMTINKNKS